MYVVADTINGIVEIEKADFDLKLFGDEEIEVVTEKQFLGWISQPFEGVMGAEISWETGRTLRTEYGIKQLRKTRRTVRMDGHVTLEPFYNCGRVVVDSTKMMGSNLRGLQLGHVIVDDALTAFGSCPEFQDN